MNSQTMAWIAVVLSIIAGTLFALGLDDIIPINYGILSVISCVTIYTIIVMYYIFTGQKVCNQK